METRKALVKWLDTGEVVERTIGIGEWDGESEEETIFFWMPLTDYQVGYSNGEWMILQIEQEKKETEAMWYLDKPTREWANEHVLTCLDYTDTRYDYRLAVIQFVELYDGTIEPYYHVTFSDAIAYSVSAKEILSGGSYTSISIPATWGATVAWLPFNKVK